LKYEYSVDKFSVPKYEISLNGNSTNCVLRISEIYREDWVISDLPENRLTLTPDKFNTLQITDISGVSKIEISIEKDNYLRIFLLYYLIILFYVLILLRGRIFVHDK
jgi:hypothetical protein